MNQRYDPTMIQVAPALWMRVRPHVPKVRRLRAPRWWAKFRARSGGYFWLPCPCCGEHFGGQEWKRGGVPVGEPPGSGRSSGICEDCVRRGYSRDDCPGAGSPIASRPGLPRRWGPPDTASG